MGEEERNPTECVGDSGVHVLMMITALQGLTAKSAAGKRRLPGDGLALPQDVFRQTPPASVIDERQRSEWRPLDWAQSRGRITPCEEIASMCLGAKWPLLSPVEPPLEGEAQRAGQGEPGDDEKELWHLAALRMEECHTPWSCSSGFIKY